MDESSDIADRDVAHNERWGFAPSYAIGLGTPTTVTLSYLHQEENNVPDFGIPFVNGEPAPVKRSNFYGLNSDTNTARDDIATARIKHDFNQDLSVSDTVRAASYLFGYHFSAPNFGSTVPTPTTPIGSILVGRDAPASQGDQTNITNQTDVTWRVETGPVSHILMVGAEFSRQTSDVGRFNNPFNKNNNFVPETSLLNPNSNEFQPPEGLSSQQNTTAFSDAGYLTDTISVTQYVDLIGGVRYDRFAASYNQYTFATPHDPAPRPCRPCGQPARRDRGQADRRPEPLFRLWHVVRSVGRGADADDQNRRPCAGQGQDLRGRCQDLVAGRHAQPRRGRVPYPGRQCPDQRSGKPTLTTLNGNQRVEGFEFGATGHITPEWEIFAGYTYLDPKTTASGTAAYVGKVLQNVARNSGNLFTEYDLTDDLEIGGGANWSAIASAISASRPISRATSSSTRWHPTN